MSDEEKDEHIEAWTYLGRRWNGTKIYYTWEQPNGEEGHFSKIKATVLGGIYSVMVNRSNPERVSVYQDPPPIFTQQRIDEERVAVLEALDREAYRQQQRAATERRMANDRTLDEALEPLLAIVKHAKSHDEMRALNAYVADKIYDAYFKRNK